MSKIYKKEHGLSPPSKISQSDRKTKFKNSDIIGTLNMKIDPVLTKTPDAEAKKQDMLGYNNANYINMIKT